MKKECRLPAVIFSLLLLGGLASGQSVPKAPVSEGRVRLDRYAAHQELYKESPYNQLHWQYLGPRNISGRCTDVEAVRLDGKPLTIWVATASGGVWKSENEGASWQPVFEQQVTTDIGDIAVDPKNPETVWVGTGEANIFRSSMAGCGIYKTTDGGKTWANMGLENTNTIARIIIHPVNTDIVWVAAGGHEWTSNPDRGIFRSDDGGRTWKKTLFINDLTGAYDLAIDPANPDILYATTWQRIREKWNDPRTKPTYTGSGVWKSVDGGLSWKAINAGLPEASKRGRIGIALAASQPEILYLLLDNYEIAYEAKTGEKDSYGRQKSSVIKGATVYRSADGGEKWEQVSGLTQEMKQFMEGHSGTYGWVFGQIRVDPKDPNIVFTLGLFLNTSTDGGKTFKRETRIHMDHHALWIDPANTQLMISGNDGGVNITYDGGKNWKHFVEIPVAQFYNVAASNTTPFHIYGSIQDHFSYRGLVDVSKGRDQLQPVNWDNAPGGEGCTHGVDPRNPNILYSCGFYGSLTRSEFKKNRWSNKSILPKPAEGEPPLRGEWVAPFVLSPHNPDILYHGMQYVFKTTDQGTTWERISPDLTWNDPAKQGDISHQTISSLSESPMKEGLVYAGTDDGRLHVTKDSGKNWTEITEGLVPGKWFSRVIASRYHEGTVYAVQNGKRDDDFQVYIWKSDDYGKTWTDIGASIPLGPVNVIREDPTIPGILYAGTDIGVYISKNEGKSWTVLGDLPSTYVHDLIIHPIDNLIIIATHGRGMFALDANPINR